MKLNLGQGLSSDLNTLVDTRVLVQANSGGGKSWCLRRLLEESHGGVQHLILDPEGEFASLRERFDYVLAAKHGADTAAEPRAATLLAERLLTLGVSAVLDLYELKAHDRVRFVRLFLEALIDAPKKLWHPALVIVDEAHVFCPQQGEAESAGAVIDLATRGRKRGFCAVLATQRLSKLHKDAAAELNNKLIGRTGLDVDVKRASDELGFGKERWRELRELEAGEFFAFGPALTREVRRVKIGPVVTSHPKAGARLAYTSPPPTDKIKALLPKLSDLPAEAEQKAKTEADLRTEIRGLKAELAQKDRVLSGVDVRTKKIDASLDRVKAKRVEVLILKDAHVKRLEAAVDRLGGMVDGTRHALDQRWDQIVQAGHAITSSIRAAVAQTAERDSRKVEDGGSTPPRRAIPVPRVIAGPGDDEVGRGGLRRILIALAQRPQGLSLPQIGVRAGLSSRSGTFSTYMSRGRQRGWIIDGGPGEASRISDEGLRALGSYDPLPTGRDLLDYWLRVLGKIGAARILRVLVEAYPHALTLEQIGNKAELGPQSGTFSTYLSRLRTLQLIEGRRQVRAAEELFS